MHNFAMQLAVNAVQLNAREAKSVHTSVNAARTSACATGSVSSLASIRRHKRSKSLLSGTFLERKILEHLSIAERRELHCGGIRGGDAAAGDRHYNPYQSHVGPVVENRV
jgi:hypothetical protein